MNKPQLCQIILQEKHVRALYVGIPWDPFLQLTSSIPKPPRSGRVAGVMSVGRQDGPEPPDGTGLVTMMMT